MNSASIIIPTFNEKNSLSTFHEKIQKIIGTNKELKLEFIFVDDGSKIPVKNQISENENVKIILNDQNYGYGYSIKKGIRNSKYDLIGIIDSDDSYDLNFLINEIRNFTEKKDLIVGKRNFNYDEGVIRKAYRYFLNKFSSFIFNYEIKDINSGIRLFKKDFFLSNEKYFPNRFSITSTQTLTYIVKDKNVEYKNTDYDKRSGKSKINLFKDPFNFIFLILKIFMLFAPTKFFTWLGLIFILSSIITAIISITFYSQIADITVLLLFLAGFNCILFGLLAESLRLK